MVKTLAGFTVSILIAFLLGACDVLKNTPAAYSKIKTKHFQNKKSILKNSDTLWILPPQAVVMTRHSFDTTTWGYLRKDSKSEFSAVEFMQTSLRKYINRNLISIEAKLDDRTNKALLQETKVMLDRFAIDTFNTYKFSDSLACALRKSGFKKCILTEMYWEYFSRELSDKLSTTMVSSLGYSKRYPPANATVIITHGMIYDAAINEAVYYKTVLTTPGGLPRQPIGHTGYETGRRSGENLFINWSIKPIVKGIRRKLKQR